MTSEQWLGLGLGGAGVIGGLALGGSGDTSVATSIGKLQKESEGASKTGDELTGAGGAGLTQALKYFSTLAGGNLADIMAATAPERTKILDQYDTARAKTVSGAPRGGGMASAMSNINAKEASDLSNLVVGARAKGAEGEAQIGQSLTSLGLNAKQLASGDLSTIVNAWLQQSQQQRQSASGFGEGLGALAGMFMAL